jgi:hypothetical protein
MYLGQTASTQFTPGSTASLSFSVSLAAGVQINAASLSSIQSMLAAWAPFASGAFTLQNLQLDNPLTPSSLTITFSVGAAGAQYTYGLLSQSIATMINSSLLLGTVAPAGLGPGLAPAPSTLSAVVNSWTLDPNTLLASWANLFSGGSGVPPPGPNNSFPWGWVLLGVGGLVAIYFLVE